MLAICEALGDAAFFDDAPVDQHEAVGREVVVVAYRLLLEACGATAESGWIWSDDPTPLWAGGLGERARAMPRYQDAVSHARRLIEDEDSQEGGGFAELAALYERLLDVGVVAAGGSHSANRPKGAKKRRRRAGAFYTPVPVVEHLLDLALEPTLDAWLDGHCGDPVERLLSFRVCDPACGTGRFLVAAQRRLCERLRSITRLQEQDALSLVTKSCLFGVDIDPCAVALGRASLERACGERIGELEDQIRVGNAVIGLWPMSDLGIPRDRHEARDWLARRGVSGKAAESCVLWSLDFPTVFEEEPAGTGRAGGFNVVLGNPPFLNQLARHTALDRGSASVLRDASGGVVRGYADMASAFLLLAAHLCREGGRVALLQPLSVLASAGAAPVRASVLGRASIESIWIADGRSFEDTGVPVCAPVFARGVAAEPVIERTRGLSFGHAPSVERSEVSGAHARTWAALAAFDVPRVPPSLLGSGTGTIGDLAACTADFRDEYYQLRGAIREATAEERADADLQGRLVTSGLIDLAECKWGRTTTQILKQRWTAPMIDEHAIENGTKLAGWISRRAVPKVLLATQTRVLEVVADQQGFLLPVTPVISIVPHKPDDLWRIAAVLASPLATVVAIRRHGGVALSQSAIKLSANQVSDIPLPTDHAAWASARDEFRRAQEAASGDRSASLSRFGRAALAAYQLSSEEMDQIFGYWTGIADLKRPM